MNLDEAINILGIKIGDEETSIKKVYRNKLKKIHPDAGGSTELTIKMNKAYEVVKKNIVNGKLHKGVESVKRNDTVKQHTAPPVYKAKKMVSWHISIEQLSKIFTQGVGTVTKVTSFEGEIKTEEKYLTKKEFIMIDDLKLVADKIKVTVRQGIIGFETEVQVSCAVKHVLNSIKFDISVRKEAVQTGIELFKETEYEVNINGHILGIVSKASCMKRDIKIGDINIELMIER